MGKFGTLAALLLAHLLVSCTSRLPDLPEMPALPSMPALPGLPSGPPPGDPACAGSWRLENGSGIAVTPAAQGLRWYSLDGQTGRFVFEKEEWRAYDGWNDMPEGRQIEFTCAAGLSVFEGSPAIAVPVAQQDTVFSGAKGTKLSGRLILPEGSEPVSIIVQVNGFDRSSALDRDPFQQLLPMQGVGVFLYDSRGTGASRGSYSQDFSLLATDAAAALAEARRLAGPRLENIGLHGKAEGGWIAPMAALGAPVDFLIVSNGLLESPIVAERSRVVAEISAAGYGPQARMAAGTLTDAAAAIVLSDFKAGYEALESLKTVYRQEPWYPAIRGAFTGDILGRSDVVLRVAGPLNSESMPWRHEGEPVLRNVKAPALWILGGADSLAPPDHTRARLKALQYEGHPVTLAEFPNAGHGMRDFAGIAPGYFSLVADFARQGGRVMDKYPAAEISPARAGASAISPE